MDRILARLIGTAILDRARRTAIGADTLGRGIVDKVAIPITRIALEGMQQAQPMARLMRRRHALVVALDRALRHRARVHITPIRRIAGRIRDVGRQRARAQHAAVQIRLEVDVQRRVRALPQRRLHGGVVRARAHRPRVVDGEVGLLQLEVHADGCVGAVERRRLRRRHGLRDAARGRRLGDHVEVGVDGDGEVAFGEFGALASAGGAGGSFFAVEGGDGVDEVIGGQRRVCPAVKVFVLLVIGAV